MNKPIYLDYNATTPIDSQVVKVMLPYLHDNFGNPSSSHHYGKITKDAVEASRRKVAESLNCTPNEVIFTSGGTESNNFAIQGLVEARRNKGTTLSHLQLNTLL